MQATTGRRKHRVRQAVCGQTSDRERGAPVRASHLANTHNGHIPLPKSAASIDRYQLLARSGHQVVCHAARSSGEVWSRLSRGERRASQQHGPRRAPPAPSLLPPARTCDRCENASVNLTRRRTNGELRLYLALFALHALALAAGSCTKKIPPFAVAYVDRSTSPSRYPLAVNPSKVGTFAGPSKSGAGYFYDEVLEYRVWLHPERGAKKLADDCDYFAAFAQYEKAAKFASEVPGAEAPVVLVQQREWINEPKPGKFTWERQERVTEWQVQWLKGSHRQPNSIKDFLAAHRYAKR